MKKYTIGDKVYRLAQDGRVIRETIFSVFEVGNSIHYNASLPAHCSGFTQAFDNEVEALEHEINALKHKLERKRQIKAQAEGAQSCFHQWTCATPGEVLCSDPPQMIYTCLKCGVKEAKVVGKI